MIPIARTVGAKKVPSTTNHLAVVAWSGKGKDTFMEWLIGQKVLNHKGLKVVDLNSIHRKEGWFYSIPNDDYKMVVRGHRLNRKRFKPQGFESEIVCVLGKKIKEYKVLPGNVKVRTLRKDDITGQDLIPFIADTTPAEGLCNVVQYIHGTKKLNVDDFQNFLERLMGKKDAMIAEFVRADPRTIFTIIRNIIDLKNSGIFSDAFPKLDISEIMGDAKTITTFSYDLIEGGRQVAMVKSVIAHKIKEYIIGEDKKKPILVYYREFQDIFDKDIGKYYDMLKDACWYFLTQGRDNKVQLMVNFQSFQQVPNKVLFQFQQLYAGGMGLKEAELLRNWATIPTVTLNKFPHLMPGQGMYIHNGEFEYLVEVVPPLNKKKEEGFPVIRFLCGLFGEQNLAELDYDAIFSEGDKGVFNKTILRYRQGLSSESSKENSYPSSSSNNLNEEGGEVAKGVF